MTADVLRAFVLRLLTRFGRPFVIIDANGARIPSIAEDVATEVRTERWRTAPSRRYGFAAESLLLMDLVYQKRAGAGQARKDQVIDGPAPRFHRKSVVVAAAAAGLPGDPREGGRDHPTRGWVPRLMM